MISNIKKIVTGALLFVTLGILLAACSSSTTTPSAANGTPNASVTSGVTTSASTTTALPGANMTPQSTFTAAANGTAGSSAATSTVTSVNAATAGVPNATVGSLVNVVQQDTGLVVIAGATTFMVSPTFERSVVAPFASTILGSPNTTSPIRYKVYTSKQTGDQILSYYDAEMTKLGLTKVTTQQTPTLPNLAVTSKLTAYTKGSNDPVAGVVTIGPMTNELIVVLGAIDPAVTSNVKAGDTVIMLLNDGLLPSIRS